MEHRSGFVNIVGHPNVGKSTLMNILVGERLSIITNKPQTTRHRIMGIVNEDDYQVVFSDTPGFIHTPQYKMQEKMNNYVKETFEDADLMLLLTDVKERYADDDPILRRLQAATFPVFLVLNKVDLVHEEEVVRLTEHWKQRYNFSRWFGISALHKVGTDELWKAIVSSLPEGPAYYPKDQLTDRSERFFITEIIREKILTLYRDEVPYSCEVNIERYKEDPDKPLVRMEAMIYVGRDTHKPIIIGKGGTAIKELGIAARKDIEAFLGKQVHLELFVKVRENWRDDGNMLGRFGYGE